MTPTPTDVLMETAANGNVAAQEFLVLWNLYCHAIDDLVDGAERPSPEALLAVFAQAAMLYSHPFYRAHAVNLLPVVLLVTSAYADSVKMEKLEGWPKRMADVLRFCGNDMVCAVALITGGYTHMRTISMQLRAVSQYEHHDDEGAPK
jgi:hypothetical protein